MSRKEELFNANKKSSTGGTIIPATVRFRHNKSAGVIEPLTAQEKMLCALRKVLADMSGAAGRYYITGNKVQLLTPPSTTQGKSGEAQSYFAVGRCRVGIALSKGSLTRVIQFSISYRDIRGEHGLADVEYFDPTSVDALPRDTPIDISALA